MPRHRYKLIAVCAALAAGQAAAAPVISPELPMDAPIFAPASGEQASPDVAHDGKGTYLVVWQDRRHALGPKVFATRVNDAGKVLDRGGIRFTQPVAGGAPVVAFGGGVFLVVWGKVASRVTTAGKLLDPQGLFLFGGAVTDVASDGQDFFVVWETGYKVYGARISAAGKVLDPAGLLISDAKGVRRNPRVASAGPGAGFLVVWQDYRSGGDNHVYGARVSSAGKLQDPAGIPISTTIDGHYLPTVAYGGGRYLVAWHTNSDIHGARVSTAGKLLDTKPIPICVHKNIRMAPSVIFGGGSPGNFMVVWKDFRDGPRPKIFGARVSAAGKVLDGDGFAVAVAAADQHQPRVAASSKGFLAIWQDNRRGETDIYGARISPKGAALDGQGFVVATMANTQQRPAVSFGGGRYLAAWEDNRNGGSKTPQTDLYAARISTTGHTLDKKGVAVSVAANNQAAAAVASGTSSQMVAWWDLRSAQREGIYGSGVTTSGQVRSPKGALVASSAQGKSGPVVAWADGAYLVAWDEVPPVAPTAPHNLRLARLGLSGKLATAPFTAGRGRGPALARGNSNTLLAWILDRQCQGATCQPARVLAARLKGEKLLDGTPLVLASLAQQRVDSVALAADDKGTTYLVVWADDRNDSSPKSNDTDIFGRRVSAAGVVLDSADLAICKVNGAQTDPAVAFYGKDFLVVWEDRRISTTLDEVDIYGARVTPTGTVRDPGGVPLAATTGQDEHGPALASDGLGRSLLTYARYSDRDFGSQRVWGRLVTWGKLPDGAPCAAAAQCVSGFCVDSVCCDSACGGGIAADCQACSTRAGGAKNGVCGPLTTSASCRKSAGPCDLEELCDAKGLVCPADRKAADGTPCPGGSCLAGKCVPRVDAALPDMGDQGTPEQRGCSCRVSGDSGGGLAVLLLLWLVRRRQMGQICHPTASDTVGVKT